MKKNNNKDIKNKKINSKTKDNGKAIGYLAPALITITIFTLLPVIWTFILSFTNNKLTNPNWTFVGFDTFKAVLNGPFTAVFVPVLLWTIVFACCATLGCFILGLIMAMLLNNKNIKERNIYKAILILPWALPAAVAIISWQGLLNGSNGAINNALINMGILSEGIPWLTDANWARFAIIMVSIWLGFPYMMNVCLGSLQSIPEEYYEAARVDGANKFIQFIKITLPSLAQTAYPLVISSFAFNFNNFGQAYLITNGNPPRMATQFAGYTDILASVNYKLSTQFGRFEIASAISIIIFILLATISYYQMKLSGQFEEVE